MAFDGFVAKSVVTELNTVLTGGKINKIYEPNKNEIVLDLYCKEKFLLDICIDSSNCRINLTNHLKQNPKVAPNFCMLLRKYLNGAKILSFETYQLDRIIIINLENYNELNDLTTYKLIVELMGKHSNILLVNEENIIIDSLRHISSEQALRVFLPANPYVFPVSDKLNLLEIDEEEFIKVVSTNTQPSLASTIQNHFTRNEYFFDYPYFKTPKHQ